MSDGPLVLGAVEPAPRPAGVRVVLDARPLQAPAHAPVTAAYLEGLLAALDANPLEGESFVLLLASDLDDPTERFGRLRVVGRRLLPPVRLLRGSSLAVDPFLVRGATIGATWRAERDGAAGAVYHATGTAVPIVPAVPVVAPLLDLAPWELAAMAARGGTARFGRRLRAQLLRDAAAVLVGTRAVAREARRRLRIRPERLRIVPLAPRADLVGRRSDATASRAERDRLGLPEAYLVWPARADARQDVRTLLDALGRLGAGSVAATASGAGQPAAVGDSPLVLVAGATPDDRALIARLAARAGVADRLAYAPVLPPERYAALVAGARAVVVPAVSDAAGLAALDALALGVPVVASGVGALPELVAGAGIVVEPGDPDRLARALATVLGGAGTRDTLAAAAAAGAVELPTWADVASATRRVWAEVAGPGSLR